MYVLSLAACGNEIHLKQNSLDNTQIIHRQYTDNTQSTLREFVSHSEPLVLKRTSEARKNDKKGDKRVF